MRRIQTEKELATVKCVTVKIEGRKEMLERIDAKSGCDGCGMVAGHFKGTKKEGMVGARERGIIITSDGEVYCDAVCRQINVTKEER